MNGGIEMGNFFQDIIAKDPQFKSPLRVSSMMLLEPITRVAVLNIVADAAAQGIALMVWETFRSRQRQRVLYDQHATQLHTVGVHHYGLAADVVKDVNGEPSWKGDFTFLVASLSTTSKYSKFLFIPHRPKAIRMLARSGIAICPA